MFAARVLTTVGEGALFHDVVDGTCAFGDAEVVGRDVDLKTLDPERRDAHLMGWGFVGCCGRIVMRGRRIEGLRAHPECAAGHVVEASEGGVLLGAEKLGWQGGGVGWDASWTGGG